MAEEEALPKFSDSMESLLPGGGRGEYLSITLIETIKRY